MTKLLNFLYLNLHHNYQYDKLEIEEIDAEIKAVGENGKKAEIVDDSLTDNPSAAETAETPQTKGKIEYEEGTYPTEEYKIGDNIDISGEQRVITDVAKDSDGNITSVNYDIAPAEVVTTPVTAAPNSSDVESTAVVIENRKRKDLFPEESEFANIAYLISSIMFLVFEFIGFILTSDIYDPSSIMLKINYVDFN